MCELHIAVKIVMFTFHMACFKIIVLLVGASITAVNMSDQVTVVKMGDQHGEPIGLHPVDKSNRLKWRSIHSEFEFQVDASKVVKNLTGFWKSTGFCPPDPHQKVCDWLHSDSVIQDLMLISAIPHSGIQYVRIHWLLDSVTISNIRDNVITYNFTCLDSFVDVLHSLDLCLIFEVMGNPSDHFSDFEDPAQVVLWKELVQELASRYVNQYGIHYVAKWYFESWNEPKRKAFDGLNMTLKGFLNYYDATAEGLRQASPQILFGGPGGECPDEFDTNFYCWALLDHAANGVNYFTGKKDVKLDFISIHKKGDPPRNVHAMIEKERMFLNLLKDHLHSISATPIFNDEADPQVSWSIDRSWQGDVTYAAMVTKAIVAHLTNADIALGLLSNDNSFLSYQPFPFTQRTLLARFQVNITSPPHIQFVRKPIYVAMGMLSLLGDQLLLGPSTRYHSLCDHPICDFSIKNLSLVATLHQPVYESLHDSWQLSIIVYFSKDTIRDSLEVTASIFLQNLPTDKELTYVVYILDNIYSNPFGVWNFSGSPPTPSGDLFREMRSLEEPIRLTGPVAWSTEAKGRIDVVMRHPSVALVHFCAKPSHPPTQVTNVIFHNVTFGEVLIIWSDTCVNSRCIKTYEVEFARINSADLFLRINPRDSFFNSFIFTDQSSRASSPQESVREGTRGWFRVRAVDYWGRAGPYSLVAPYPSANS